MREILFRGQTRRKGQKVWMDGTPVESNWVYGGICLGTDTYSVIYTYDPIDKYPVYTDTVGQYTGLIDKNGKKIFEGDIVRNGDHTMIVIWCDFYAAFKLAFRADGDHFEVMSNSHIYLEVIGNIHDNPELLGGVSDGN